MPCNIQKSKDLNCIMVEASTIRSYIFLKFWSVCFYVAVGNVEDFQVNVAGIPQI